MITASVMKELNKSKNIDTKNIYLIYFIETFK